VVKAIGIAGFIIACVALWLSLSAMNDSRRALVLAEWTAWKDFLGVLSSGACKYLNFRLDFLELTRLSPE
jgi:hypothetical protein